jgi:hypothetical protein
VGYRRTDRRETTGVLSPQQSCVPAGVAREREERIERNQRAANVAVSAHAAAPPRVPGHMARMNDFSSIIQLFTHDLVTQTLTACPLSISLFYVSAGERSIGFGRFSLGSSSGLLLVLVQ